MSVIESQPPNERHDDIATLRVHRAGSIDVERLWPMLADGAWLGQLVEDPAVPAGVRRYLTDLVLPLPPDGRVLSLRKATLLDIGPAVRVPGGCDVELAWRSASLAPLFPVFAGRLEARATGLSIEGHYAPPGGALGRTADRMLLHTAARGTARWLLGHVAAALRSGPPAP